MYYIMYMILIISTIFQDLPILEGMGNFGSAITSLITIIFFIIYVLANKKILIEKQEKKLIHLAIYLLIVDAISIIVMFFTNELYAVNEYLPIKTIKGYIFFATNICILILLTNIQSKLDVKKVFYPFFITFIILFIILIVEIVNPELLNIFHRDKLYILKYGRIRLLTEEASYTTTLIILNFALAFFYANYIKKKKILTVILCAMLAFFMYRTTSKSLLIIFLVTAIIVLITNKKISKKYKIYLMIGLFIASCFAVPYIYRLIVVDLKQYTSTITRTYCLINAILVSIVFPFGVGNGQYLPIYLKFLEKNFSILNSMPKIKNTSEIQAMINTTSDANISAKSGVLQYGIYWGIIGTIYFMSFLYDIYKSIRRIEEKEATILEFGLVFLIINITFAIDFDCRYEIFTYLSVMIYYIKNYNSIHQLIEEGKNG